MTESSPSSGAPRPCRPSSATRRSRTLTPRSGVEAGLRPFLYSERSDYDKRLHPDTRPCSSWCWSPSPATRTGTRCTGTTPRSRFTRSRISRTWWPSCTPATGQRQRRRQVHPGGHDRAAPAEARPGGSDDPGEPAAHPRRRGTVRRGAAPLPDRRAGAGDGAEPPRSAGGELENTEPPPDDRGRLRVEGVRPGGHGGRSGRTNASALQGEQLGHGMSVAGAGWGLRRGVTLDWVGLTAPRSHGYENLSRRLCAVQDAWGPTTSGGLRGAVDPRGLWQTDVGVTLSPTLAGGTVSRSAPRPVAGGRAATPRRSHLAAARRASRVGDGCGWPLRDSCRTPPRPTWRRMRRPSRPRCGSGCSLSGSRDRLCPERAPPRARAG